MAESTAEMLERRAIQAAMTKERKAKGEPRLSPHEARRLATEEMQRRHAGAGRPARTGSRGPTAARAANVAAAAAAPASTSGVSAIAGAMAGVGTPTPTAVQNVAAAQPATPDPAIAAALAATVQLVQPTWKIQGKFFHCWSPNGQKEVILPIEPKPGPLTPAEEVHPVLGMPDMLYTVCLAIAEGEGSLLVGPTGVAKTTVYRWLAKTLNWNFVAFPMHKDIASEDLIGEYKPFEGKTGEMILRWSWGMVSKAVLASQEHPTIGVFEEINRVGNLQVFARLYSLLDDTRELVIDEKGDKDGFGERLRPGKLFFGANMNPADSGDSDIGVADYIGVQELDPALGRRFPTHREVGYPPEEIEAEALRRRVPGLPLEEAKKMVETATRVRRSPENRFPMSFPDMVMWAKALPYYGWEQAAEISVVAKAHPTYRAGIRNLLGLQPTAAGMP